MERKVARGREAEPVSLHGCRAAREKANHIRYGSQHLEIKPVFAGLTVRTDSTNVRVRSSEAGIETTFQPTISKCSSSAWTAHSTSTPGSVVIWNRTSTCCPDTILYPVSRASMLGELPSSPAHTTHATSTAAKTSAAAIANQRPRRREVR